jgi:hypothetical protein
MQLRLQQLLSGAGSIQVHPRFFSPLSVFETFFLLACQQSPGRTSTAIVDMHPEIVEVSFNFLDLLCTLWCALRPHEEPGSG